jgi:putative endonuclease
MNTRKIGTDGESKAVDFLQKNGYLIIERNVHFGKIGEIDIVAADPKDGATVFVEVKYNRNDSSSFGAPEFRFNVSKIRQLTKLAQMYIRKKNLYGKPVRIDAIAIDPNGIRHYKNCGMGL